MCHDGIGWNVSLKSELLKNKACFQAPWFVSPFCWLLTAYEAINLVLQPNYLHTYKANERKKGGQNLRGIESAITFGRYCKELYNILQMLLSSVSASKCINIRILVHKWNVLDIKTCISSKGAFQNGDNNEKMATSLKDHNSRGDRIPKWHWGGR